jgi:hypothetical protein
MSILVSGCPNIILDPASKYTWDNLNETEFLSEFFIQLRSRMGESFRNYNFIIYSSHGPDALPASASARIPNKILFFISDESSNEYAVNSVLKLQENYQVIFKSYLPRELPNTKVHPFQLGYVKGVPRHKVKIGRSRRLNLFFSGALHRNRFEFYYYLNPVATILPRRAAVRMIRWFSTVAPRLRELTFDKFIGAQFRNSRLIFTRGFKKGISAEEYASILHESKIALCPKGLTSAETFRHMEAMRAGCVVISEQLPRTRFYRNSPIITVRNWGEGLEVARQLLAEPALLEKKQEETLSWWENVCSERATAEYVEKIISHQ